MTVRKALIIKNLTNIQRSQKSTTTGIKIKHNPIPKTDIVTAINGLRILKIFVAVAAPMNWATALTVNIHDRVFTVVPQFAASVGKVGPVTLKKSPIDILAPTMAAMNSLVQRSIRLSTHRCEIFRFLSTGAVLKLQKYNLVMLRYGSEISKCSGAGIPGLVAHLGLNIFNSRGFWYFYRSKILLNN